jgi:hypothetical protein
MDKFAIFIGALMQSRNQAHVYHLQTDSFAAHKALNEYYDEIIDLIDGLVESYQGRYGILRNYKISGAVKEDDNPIMYFKALSKFVETVRRQCPQDSYIQNEIDNVVKLIESTSYKLNYLR